MPSAPTAPAPAQTPSAPTAPVPTATASPAEVIPSPSTMPPPIPSGKAQSAAFDAVDRLASGEPEVTEPSKAKPQEATPDDKAKLAPPSKPTEQPKTSDPQKPMKADQLRSLYETTKKEVSEWKSKYESLQKEVSTPKENPKEKELSEKLSDREKRLQQLDEELRYTAYERSQEFKEKYEVPFQKAYSEGVELTESFQYKEPDKTDATTGETIPGATRAGTKEDWYRFMMMDNAEANKFAHDHFGYDAAQMIQQRRDVIKLTQSKAAALEEFRSKGAERDKARREAFEKQAGEFRELFKRTSQTALEDPKNSRWFKAEEGDLKGKEILEKGFEITDRGFSDTSKMTPQERAELHSAIRNRSGAFSYLKYLVQKQDGKIAELEKQLKEFEASEPGQPAKGNRQVSETEPANGFDAFERAAKKAARMA